MHRLWGTPLRLIKLTFFSQFSKTDIRVLVKICIVKLYIIIYKNIVLFILILKDLFRFIVTDKKICSSSRVPNEIT